MLKETQIRELIDKDRSSLKKQLALVGQRYYEADHDIKQYRMFYYNSDGDLVEDKTRTNVKIAHPFFTELADQLTAFILSSTDSIITSDAEGLQDLLDEYFDDEFWAEFSETITGAYVKGFDYIYAYKGEDDRLHFQYADSLDVVEVREKDTDERCACYIYSYVDHIDKDGDKIIKIQLHTADEIYYYIQETKSGAIVFDKDEPINPLPNVITEDEKGEKYGSSLGFCPFFKLGYTRKEFSGLKPIKDLIDDYDLIQCGLTNNIQDFDNPILLVKGFNGDNLDELQTNVKTKKLLGVDDDGGLEVKTVDIPYQARKTKADEDEKNIYRFGMGLNTQGLKDTSATTNLLIKAAYTLLDLKADKFEKRIKKLLKKDIIKVILDEINDKNGTGYQVKDVKINFPHDILTNETENIQNEQMKAMTRQIEINNILSAAAYIGDDEVLRALCEIFELDFDEVQEQLEMMNDESNLAAAQEQLAGMGVEDEAEESEEEFEEDFEEEPEDELEEEAEEVDEDGEEVQGISEEERQTQQAVLDMLDELLKELE